VVRQPVPHSPKKTSAIAPPAAASRRSANGAQKQFAGDAESIFISQHGKPEPLVKRPENRRAFAAVAPHNLQMAFFGRIPLLAILFILSGVPARSADLLDKWIAAQANLRTWTADIVQTRSFKTLAQPLVADGKVWIAVPDRFRWELGQPPQTIALRQAAELMIVYPRLKRVEKYPLLSAHPGPWQDALALLEASFPRSRTNMEAKFQILALTETNGVATLALQPRSGAARKFIARLDISFREDDFTPVGTALTFSDGSSLRNEFYHPVVNPPLDPQLFEVKMEPDFTTVEPLKQ
jgi:outer membrane lipoprotein-sorting protein